MIAIKHGIASREAWLRYRALLIPAAVLVAIAVLALIEKDFGKLFPLDDDAALVIVAVHGHFADWVSTKGTSDLLFVFPEWSTGYANFLRPADFIIVYLQSLIFGHWYAGYFLAYYMAAGASACLIYDLCVRNRVAISHAMFAALLCVVSPAVIGQGLFNISFTFDVICGFFVILAFYFLVREKLALCAAALILGVLTKETALYAVVAAAVSAGLWKKQRPWAFVMLSLIIIWGGLRRLAFGSIFGGVYAVQYASTLERIKLIARGFLTWPGGVWVNHGAGGFALSPVILILMAANIVLWLYLALSVLPWLLRPRRFVEAFAVPEERTRAAALVWLGLGLAYCVGLSVEGRFGGSVFPLLYLYMALDLGAKGAPQLFASPMLAWRQRLLENRVTQAALAVILLLFAAAQAVINLPNSLPSNPEKRRTLAFRQALQALPPHTGVVYVVNAPYINSQPDTVASYLGLSVHLVYVTQVYGCLTSDRIRGDGVQMDAAGLVTVRLPPCASFEFAGVDQDHMRKLTQSGGLRNGQGAYRFPRGHTSPGLMGAVPVVDLGDTLDWQPAIAPGATVMTYSWNNGTYVIHPLTRSAPIP